MNFCTKCGGQNQAGTNNCTFCGQQLAQSSGNSNMGAPPQGQPNNFGQPPNNLGQPPFGSGMPAQPQNKGNALGITSLIIGIISVIIGCCFSPLGGLGLVALILGAVSIKNSDKKGLSIAGLILGIVALLIAVFGSIYFFGTGFYQDIWRDAWDGASAFFALGR